jgi:mannose-6-phosphate isomerase-like protein (cupin superfamily)
MSRYTFRDLILSETVAHGGQGFVRTTRVADERSHSGLYFIDLTEVPPGHSIGVHTHGFKDEEVYVIVAGHGEMTLNGHTFDVEPGDVVVNSRGGTHALTNTGSEILRLVVLDVRA